MDTLTPAPVNEIRDEIISLMASKGITPNDVFSNTQTNVSRSLFYDYLRGKHDLTTHKASAILRFLRSRRKRK